MKTLYAAFATAALLLAAPVHAQTGDASASAPTAPPQTLTDHLAAMADHSERSADLAAAAKSSFDNGWTQSGCASMDSSLAELQASLDELIIMENMVNADTAMSDADREDWLGHIHQQRPDTETALSVGRQRRAEHCT